MKHLLRAIIDQIRRLLLSRLGLALFVLFALMSVATGAVYHQLVLRDVRVVVVDLDNTHLSRLLASSLDATPELAVTYDSDSSPERAQAALARGELGAYVLIPNGFTERAKSGKRGGIVLFTDMSNLLVGKTVRSAASRVVATLNVGIEMGVLRKLGSSRTAAAAEAYPVVVEDNQLFNPATNYAEYLVPVVVFFLWHIYTTVLLSGYFMEQDPSRSRIEHAGAIFTILVFSVAVGLATWKLLPHARVSVASPWRLWCCVLVAYALAQAAFVWAVMTVVPSSKLAFQVILFLSMLGLMLAGVTWPTFEFPPLFAQAAEALPFTHLGRALRILVHFEASLGDLEDVLRALAKSTAVFVTIVASAKTVAYVVRRAWQGSTRHEASL